MKHTYGFVLIELVVVFGVVAALTTMTMINIFGAKRGATLDGDVDTLVADLKSQQGKAMSGTEESGYGIYFEPTQYVLFRGTVYNAAESSNAPIPIDSRETFSAISLPGDSVVFAARSGEFIGYDEDANSVTIYHSDSGESKTIHLNRYGIVTSID